MGTEKMGSEQRSIVYFSAEGAENRKQTITLAAERARELGLGSLVIFTSQGEGAYEALEVLGSAGPKVVAVTYPSEKVFYQRKKDSDELEELRVGVPEDREKELEARGAVIVRAALPFAEIFVAPGTTDPKLAAIRGTLDLFGGGMTLCVQAVLMACDKGAVRGEEEIVACAADTAVVVKACHEEDLFTPWGLEIREVIAKPRLLTITKHVTDD